MSSKLLLAYTVRAQKDLSQLDKKVAKRITDKIFENAHMVQPLTRASTLTGEFSGLYRYRIGDYRVIFKYDKNGVLCILTVLRVAHRKDVYE